MLLKIQLINAEMIENNTFFGKMSNFGHFLKMTQVRYKTLYRFKLTLHLQFLLYKDTVRCNTTKKTNS